MSTFKSFAALGAALKAQEYEAHAADREAAAKLRRIAPAQKASNARRGVVGPAIIRVPR